VERAIDYYMDWAGEVRSRVHQWNFIYEYYAGLLNPRNVSGIRFRALFFATRLQPVLSYVSEFNRAHGRPPYILDLGCGFGLESALISLAGARVHGIDGWRDMIKHADTRLRHFESRRG